MTEQICKEKLTRLLAVACCCALLFMFVLSRSNREVGGPSAAAGAGPLVPLQTSNSGPNTLHKPEGETQRQDQPPKVKEKQTAKKEFGEASKNYIPCSEAMLDKQRTKIDAELQGMKFHPSLNIKNSSQLIYEKGGKPVINIILTTWRSGSTFLGEMLEVHPATFYHYEPLLHIGIRQARSGSLGDMAVNHLHNLMTCNYTKLDDYVNYGVGHPFLWTHNTRLWWLCYAFRQFCLDKQFLTSFCKLFPFQSVKVVRLRMNLTESFLQDPELDVRILMLVRDPRGTLQSRKHRDWCPGKDDCDNPERLCDDLVSDYHAARRITQLYPGRVRVVRYEDVSFNIESVSKDLLDFFRLSYEQKVKKFLMSHTKVSKGGVSSTFRDSKSAPVHWQRDLKFQEVSAIQDKCSEAMKLFGYNLAIDEDHLRNFDPIGPFEFDVP